MLEWLEPRLRDLILVINQTKIFVKSQFSMSLDLTLHFAERQNIISDNCLQKILNKNIYICGMPHGITKKSTCRIKSWIGIIYDGLLKKIGTVPRKL